MRRRACLLGSVLCGVVTAAVAVAWVASAHCRFAVQGPLGPGGTIAIDVARGSAGVVYSRIPSQRLGRWETWVDSNSVRPVDYARHRWAGFGYDWPPPRRRAWSFARAAFPLWCPAAAGAVGAVALGRIARRKPATATVCPRCGYDLRATPDRCPECGAVPVRGKS